MDKVPLKRFINVKLFGKIFFVIILSFFYSNVNAQFRTFSNEFLRIGATARGTSMGNSNFASGFGAENIFYTPAQTALSTDLSFALTHSNYFNSMANYDFFAATYPIDSATIGIGFIRLGIDNIPNTLAIYNNGLFDLSKIKYFSIANNALMLTYAKKLKHLPILSYGLRLNLIYNNLGPFAKGFGFGLDFSIFYHAPHKFNLALSLNNFTTTPIMWFYTLDSNTTHVLDSTGNQIPKNHIELSIPYAICALSRSFTIKKIVKLTLEASSLVTFATKNSSPLSSSLLSLSPRFGLEINYKNTFFIRFGAYNFQKIKYFTDSIHIHQIVNFFPTIGFGIKYKNFYLDYCIDNLANKAVNLQSHFFTIRMFFKQEQLQKLFHSQSF